MSSGTAVSRVWSLTLRGLYEVNYDLSIEGFARNTLQKIIFGGKILTVGLVLSGCAIAGNSLSDISTGDQLVTNSVVKKTKPEGIAETDAEIIKSTVSAAKVSKQIKPLAWRNPDTGSSGTIVAIDNFMGKHGQQCRGFKTSVDNFLGISFYNGEACQISANQWVLSWFKSAD